MEYKILLIDDNPDDQFFFKKALEKAEIKADVITVDDGVAGIKMFLEYEFDCVFLDYNLPGMNGLEFLRELRSLEIDTPIIMLTGQKSELTVVKLMQAGANYYLSKNSLTPESLRLSIENSQKLYQIKKEKQLAEAALKISEARLAEAQRIAHIGNWEFDFNERKTFFSEEAYHILEYDPYGCKPSFLSFIRKICMEDFFILKECLDKLKHNPNYDITFRINTKGGTLRYINAKGHLLAGDNDKKIIGTIQDITELKNALKDTRKATIKSKATTIVFSVAIIIFLLSEAVLDPFVDSLSASLLISLSFKGSIALVLKPVEGFLEKIMMSRII